MATMGAKGQSLAEYTLIAFILLGAAIPVVNILGSNVTTALQAILNGMTNNMTVVEVSPTASPTQSTTTTAQATAPIEPVADPLATAPVTTTASSPSGPTATLQMRLQNGSVIELSKYPTNISQYVETTGTNGATLVLLAQLDTIIAELSKDPNASPQQLAYLQTLANQGHRIAQIEGLLENTMNSATSVNELRSTRINFDGTSYRVSDLSYLIGWHGGAGEQSYPTDVYNPLDAANTGTELGAFINLYHQAAAAGVLNDPAINSVVTELSNEISYLTEVVEYSVWSTINTTRDLEGFGALEVSSITNFDSSQICYSGGSSDTGTYCQ